MNGRENIQSLYGRTGYEFMPIEIKCCPIIHKKITDAVGGKKLADYYDYPEGFQSVSPKEIKRKNAQDINWRNFYEEELNEDTWLSAYGTAHEGGYKNSDHMRRAHHPMAKFDSLEPMSYILAVWHSEVMLQQPLLKNF